MRELPQMGRRMPGGFEGQMPFRGPGGYDMNGMHGMGHPLLGLLFGLMILALLAAGIYALVRLARRNHHGPSLVAATGPAGSGGDPALAELRLRYARGDVSRDDYLQRSADLTGKPLEVPKDS